MKNVLRLDIMHPDKGRVEHFLNKVDGDLEQVRFDVSELNGVDDRIVGFKFNIKGRSAFIVVILARSYSNATEIEAANLTTRPEIKWTINGEILFGVASVDESISKEILSVFAGRE